MVRIWIWSLLVLTIFAALGWYWLDNLKDMALQEQIEKQKEQSKELSGRIDEHKRTLEGLTEQGMVDSLRSMSLTNRWRRHNHDVALLMGLHAYDINEGIRNAGQRKPTSEIHDVLQSALAASPYSGTFLRDRFGDATVGFLSKIRGRAVAFASPDQRAFVLGPTLSAAVEPFSDCADLVDGRRFFGAGENKLAVSGKQITLVDRQGCSELQQPLVPPVGARFDTAKEHWASEDGRLIVAFLKDGRVAFYRVAFASPGVPEGVLRPEDLVSESRRSSGTAITVVTGADGAIALGDDEGNVCVIPDWGKDLACGWTGNPLLQPQWKGIDYARLGTPEHRGAKSIAALRLESGGSALWVAYKGSTLTGGERLFVVEGLDSTPLVNEVLPDSSSRALWKYFARF